MEGAFAEEGGTDEADVTVTKEKAFPLGLDFTLENYTGINRENPKIGTTLTFIPKFKLIGEDFFISARLDLEKEWTNSDDTTDKNELVLSDLYLALSHNCLYQVPVVDLKFKANVRIYFPTSLASYLASMYAAIGPSVGLSWSKWGITAGYDFRFTYYFYEDGETPITQRSYPDNPDDGLVNYHAETTGSRTKSYQLTHLFTLGYNFTEELALMGYLYIMNGRTSTFETSFPSFGDIAQVGEKDSFWAIFELSYQFVDWFGLSLGLSTYAPQLTPGSDSYYNPFGVDNYNNYTTVYLDANITL